MKNEIKIERLARLPIVRAVREVCDVDYLHGDYAGPDYDKAHALEDSIFDALSAISVEHPDGGVGYPSTAARRIIRGAVAAAKRAA
jgi:hypothetical protein